METKERTLPSKGQLLMKAAGSMVILGFGAFFVLGSLAFWIWVAVKILREC